jgi:hypothetical protein
LTRFVGHSACRLAAIASRNRIAALALSAPRPRPAGRMSREESGIPLKRSAPQNSAAPSSRFRISPLPSHPTCQFRKAGAACSHG